MMVGVCVYVCGCVVCAQPWIGDMLILYSDYKVNS